MELLIYIKTLINLAILLALREVIPLSCQHIDYLTSIVYFLQTACESPMTNLVIDYLRLQIINRCATCNQHKHGFL